MAETSTIFGFMKYVSATDILSDFKKTVDSHFVNSLRLFLRKSHTSKWRARFVSSRPVTFQYPLHFSESFGIPIHSVFIDGVFIVCFYL